MGDKPKRHPPFSRVIGIIDNLARNSVEEVLLVGGDPCTYPRLKDVVEFAEKAGLSVGILSNTLFFRKADFSTIIEKVDSFEATILGSTADAHDQVSRHKGSYDILVRNMKALTDIGIPTGIVLNATPKTYNGFYTTIVNLVKQDVLVRDVLVQRIIPQGLAKNLLKYSLNDVKKIGILFSDLEKLSKDFNLAIRFEDPFPLCFVDSKYHKFLSPCEWGYFRGSIDPEGNISRCGADPRYRLGNMFNCDVKELWETSPTLISFRSRDWLPEYCHRCVLLEKCGGGCSLSRITDKDHEPDILCP